MMEPRFEPTIHEIIGRMHGMAYVLDSDDGMPNVAEQLHSIANSLVDFMRSNDSITAHKAEIFNITQYLQGISYVLHDIGYEMSSVAIKDFVDGLDKILDTI